MSNSRWAKHLLTIVGIYYLLSGIFNAMFPKVAFKVADMVVPSHLFMWQHANILLTVLGFGFLIAANNPTRYWPIVFMGILKMTSGIFGFVFLLIQETISLSFGIHVLLSDALWVIPLFLILRWAFRQNMSVEESLNYMVFGGDEVEVSKLEDQHGNVIELDDAKKPVLLVFLRHFGCIFCRETLTNLARDRKLIERLGTKVVIVHLSEDSAAKQMLAKYGLQDLSRVSDIDQTLYEAFGLETGDVSKVVNLKGILRMMDLMMFKGTYAGKPDGDMLQMPGAFLVHEGRIVNAFKHETAADCPDFLRLAAAPEF